MAIISVKLDSLSFIILTKNPIPNTIELYEISRSYNVMKLLAISGFKRSGKDTLADYLVENYNAKRTSFAGPLKDNVARDFSIPREWCDDPNFKEKALLKYPVTPKDAFGMNIVKFMFKEFRSLEGDTATHFVEEKNMGLCGHELKVLYHTPRSLCILEGSTKRSVDSSYWVQQAIKEVLVNNGLS